MLGVVVNTITVILGSAVGLLFKKGIPDRVSSAIMNRAMYILYWRIRFSKGRKHFNSYNIYGIWNRNRHLN